MILRMFDRAKFSKLVADFLLILERRGIELILPDDPGDHFEDIFEAELFRFTFGMVEARGRRVQPKRLVWSQAQMDETTLEFAAVMQANKFADVHEKENLQAIRKAICHFLEKLGYAETDKYDRAPSAWGCYPAWEQLARRGGYLEDAIYRYRFQCRKLYPDSYQK